MLPSGGRRSLQGNGEALGGSVRLSPTPCAELNVVTRVAGSQYARAAGHVSTETNRGFALRYYNATHIWASTTTAGTLLRNRVVGVRG
jgi:hypothetical protein